MPATHTHTFCEHAPCVNSVYCTRLTQWNEFQSQLAAGAELSRNDPLMVKFGWHPGPEATLWYDG